MRNLKDSSTLEARKLLRRRLCKLSRESEEVPSVLLLSGVKHLDGRIYGAGGFADVLRGSWNDQDVALKTLRVFKMIQPSLKEGTRKVVLF